MHPFFQHPTVRRARILFRWCRIFLWLVLLVVVAVVAYLHLMGLPDFAKRPMLRRLLADGIAAQFSNIQLGWERGPSIIIENAAFSRANQPLSPRLSASRGELSLDWNALRRLQVELHSLRVSDARLDLPISETNGDALSLSHVAVDLRFFSNDVVWLDRFQGDFRGIQLDMIARVNHASDLRHWRFPTAATNKTYAARLRQVATVVREINLSGIPVLQIEAAADGRDMNSFHAEMNFQAPAAQTPWGNVTNLVLNAACARLAKSSPRPFLQVKGSAESVTAARFRAHTVVWSSMFSRGVNSNLDADTRLEASQFSATMDPAGSNRLDAAHLSWIGKAVVTSSNFLPVLAIGKLQVTALQTEWGAAQELSVTCRVAPARGLPPPVAAWGPWTRLAPWALDWRADMRNVTHPKLRLDHLAVSGHWRAPRVIIDSVEGELYQGWVKAMADLDIGSRELRCNGTTDLNPNSIAQLFKPAAQSWLAQFDWTAAPKVKAEMRVVLPPWTNRPPGWSAEMGSSLQLAGDFTAGPAAFRQVTVNSGRAHVTYTNRVWNVSRLRAVRSDGEINLDYTAGPQGFHYVVDSRLNPKAALPLLPPGQQHIMDELIFQQPPQIHAEIAGPWHVARALGFAATVRASNFLARGETVSSLNFAVDYTNQVLTVRDFSLSNIQCHVRVPWLQADFGTKMVRLTNVTGALDPGLLQRVLRKNPPDFLKTLRFDSLPSVSAHGSFSYTNALATDLHFLVAGQHVHYNLLRADSAAGAVDWTGRTIAVTNVVAHLYHNGTLMGWIAFYSRPKHGTDLHGDFSIRDIDLPTMVSGFTGKTNRLEGRLDGDLIFGGPNTADISNWHGQGRVHVYDALLWDIKIFGLLSPVLNLFSPGWGHSRAREATADFLLTNGTLSSDNIAVHSTGFRLNIRGSVNKNKQINARLEAILSRGTPLIGPVLSMVFTPLSKLFEYHISGSWSEPALEPVFVPRFIMFLLHPFKGLKSSPAPEPPAAVPPAGGKN